MPERLPHIARRYGDGGPLRETWLEVQRGVGVHDAGDMFVVVRGLDSNGKPVEARVEFCSPRGGGWHPETIQALNKLIEAIQKDNSDPDCPVRYRIGEK